MKKVLKEIREVWGKDDDMDWIGLVWLIKKQINEIEDGNFDEDVVIKELADILIIGVRFLDRLGLDPRKVMLWRLNTRHRGRVEEIVAKYRKMREGSQS